MICVPCMQDKSWYFTFGPFQRPHVPGATLAYFGAEVVKVRVSQAAADGLLLHNRMLQVPQVVSWFTDTRYFELLHSLFIVWFITGGVPPAVQGSCLGNFNAMFVTMDHVFLYIYIHTYIHAYIHTYIHTYIHHTYMIIHAFIYYV